MKKQAALIVVLIVALAVYTTYTSKTLTQDREKFVESCQSNNGIYAEGVLTKMQWRPEGCTTKKCDETKDGKGKYLLTFVKHDLVKPTLATLPGVKKELDTPRRKLDHGKSYSLCMKKDYELIDYYKSF